MEGKLKQVFSSLIVFAFLCFLRCWMF